MEAVFASVPVAPGETVPVRLNVAVPLTRRSTFAAIAPAPDAGHDEPADATQDQFTPESAAGGVSETVAPVTAEGP